MQEHSPCTPCTEHAVLPGPWDGGCGLGWRRAAPSPGSPPTPASWPPPPPPSATATSPPSPLQGTIAWVRSQSYHSFHGLQCLYTLILQLLTTEEWGVCGWRPNTGGWCVILLQYLQCPHLHSYRAGGCNTTHTELFTHWPLLYLCLQNCLCIFMDHCYVHLSFLFNMWQVTYIQSIHLYFCPL